MDFQLDEGAIDAVLNRAILLYENVSQSYSGKRDQETVLATIHDVFNAGTADEPNLQILSGYPITKAGLMQAFGHLADNYLTTLDLFPEHLLGHSPRHMLWWRPAAKAPIFFSASGVGKRSKVVDHPPLLFLVVDKKWSVFALKESKRPTLQTELYQAPYFNVYDDGSICVGSIKTPEANPGAIPAWEEAFFLSEFTYRHGRKKTSNEKGDAAFWCDMLDGVYDTFPLDKLTPQGIGSPVTVASLLENMHSRSE